MTTLAEYYRLTKPGLVYGNALTTLCGLLYASRWGASWSLLLATLLGLGFVVASACAFNNCLDRSIDAKMERTRTRALVAKTIPLMHALIFSTALALVGFYLLAAYVNMAALIAALVGFVFYLGPYTFLKRYSHWGALVGSVAGAMPIVAGYVAAAGAFDEAALVLFFILALWQMPHFYAIAIYRLSDYEAADIPVLPARRGLAETKWQILIFAVLFAIAALALHVLGYAGKSYFYVMLLMSAVWVILSLRGFFTKDEARWARAYFLYSLAVLLAFSFALAASPLLP